MRVLTVIAEMGSGGAESIAAQLASAAAGRGEDVTLATHGGWRVDALADQGVGVVQLPMRSRGIVSLLRSTLLVRRRLSVRPVDVVHAHNVRATVVARLGSQRRRGRPAVVSTIHGLAPQRYQAAARLLRVLADEVVAVSEEVAAQLVDAGVPRRRLHVIVNAAPSLPAMRSDQARRALGVPTGVPIALCLARLEPPKRHDLLLEAWADVPAPALLVIAGAGSRSAGLERQAARLGLSERVVFLGDRHDVGRLMSAGDLLVLPSDREGLPLVVLESMAFGLPVVASRVGGLASMDPSVLRLVEPGSSAALARALRESLADPGSRRSTAASAQELVRSRYSVASMVAAYADLFVSARAGRAG